MRQLINGNHTYYPKLINRFVMLRCMAEMMTDMMVGSGYVNFPTACLPGLVAGWGLVRERRERVAFLIYLIELLHELPSRATFV